jgi:hypothetical protein
MRPMNQPTQSAANAVVRTLLDDMADIVFGVHGALPYHLGGIRRGVLCVTVKILGGSRRLVDEPVRLALGVAGHAAETFLHFAAHVPGGTRDTIFVHWNVLALVKCPFNPR